MGKLSKTERIRNISDMSIFPGITPNEVSQLWGLAYNTVIYHITEGNYKARKSANTWLIDISSVIIYSGDPKNHYFDGISLHNMNKF